MLGGLLSSMNQGMKNGHSREQGKGKKNLTYECIDGLCRGKDFDYWRGLCGRRGRALQRRDLVDCCFRLDIRGSLTIK